MTKRTIPDRIERAYAVPEPLKETLHNYINVNAGGGERLLGESFEDPLFHKYTGDRDLLKQQLADMVVNHLVSMQNFKNLTLYSFDTEEEYQDYLRNEFWPEVFPGEKPEDYCSKQDE